MSKGPLDTLDPRSLLFLFCFYFKKSCLAAFAVKIMNMFLSQDDLYKFSFGFSCSCDSFHVFVFSFLLVLFQLLYVYYMCSMTRSKAGKKLRWYGHLTRALPMQSVSRSRRWRDNISGFLGVPLDKLEEVAGESEVLVAVLRVLPTTTWLHKSERK